MACVRASDGAGALREVVTVLCRRLVDRNGCPGLLTAQKSRLPAFVSMTGTQDFVITAQAVQKSYRVEYDKTTEPP